LRLFPDGSTTGSTDINNAFFTSSGLSFSAAPRTLRVSLENLTDAPVNGYAMAYAAAIANGVSAVPEPQSGVLLLAGIAAVGFAARQRKGR
jgi:hypothetical protein